MFKIRSLKKELLDSEQIPEKDLFKNLRELDFINNYLGGYGVTFSALIKLLKPDQTYTLVDIGSGGGDTLKRIDTWAKGLKNRINLFGIDIKSVCIKYSLEKNPHNSIKFFCDDYRNIFNHVPKVDIIHASLFCHHLTEIEIIALIKFSYEKGCILVINDLERNAFAYYAIKWLTLIFSGSYLVKNDAPLSVLRGFKKSEWISILKASGVNHYSVENKWAFRHCIIVDGKR